MSGDEKHSRSDTAEASTSRAVALRYASPEDLPSVLANGSGEIARRILRVADENDIPVIEDPTLAGILSGLGAGAAVSEESYELIADILCFLYESDVEWQKRHAFIGAVIGNPDRKTSF